MPKIDHKAGEEVVAVLPVELRSGEPKTSEPFVARGEFWPSGAEDA